MQKPIINGNRITIPSDQEYLADVDSFLDGQLRELTVGESIRADIAISVSELVNNAILHGNKSSPEKVVTVEISSEPGQVTIAVSDQGTGFTEEQIDDPVADENLLKEVGRGIFIVRALMDDVDISASERGTTISISKSF